MSSEIPQLQQYSHSVKIEDSAKGIRISVHVYTNNKYKAIDEVIKTYLDMKAAAEANKLPVAPMEISK